VTEAKGVVLVVEDEVRIAELERLYLVREGFEVHLCTDGLSVANDVAQLRPVVIVLDVGLPGVDGLTILEELRSAGDWTPVIVVTARDEEVSRLRGLDSGADDYITKPFSPRELVSRVNAVLRRTRGPQEHASITVGLITVDTGAHTVAVGNVTVALSGTEYALLDHLMRQPGRVLSRAELLSQVWGYTAPGGTRTVDVHIAQLRAKLGSAAGQITTVRGIGYRLDPTSSGLESGAVDVAGATVEG
jgi:DNA-binding response OmpR family regulator